jgi:septation ring formation regulator EzrA
MTAALHACPYYQAMEKLSKMLNKPVDEVVQEVGLMTLNGETINECRAMIKEHTGIEATFFDDCVAQLINRLPPPPREPEGK